MGLSELIDFLITCLWVPMFVNIVISGKYGVKRVICTITIFMLYSIIGLNGGTTEIVSVIVILLSMLTVYLTMGRSYGKAMSVPVAYVVTVFCNYSIYIFVHSICDIDLENANNVIYNKLEYGLITVMVFLLSIFFFNFLFYIGM